MYIYNSGRGTDMYEVPDAVPPIHAVSSHVATDKDPSKFRSMFSDNLQPIATRGKNVARYWSISAVPVSAHPLS